jgi:hypothetical protein
LRSDAVSAPVGLACSGREAIAKNGLQPTGLTAELLKANSCAPIVLSDRAGMGYELNLDALAKAWVK